LMLPSSAAIRDSRSATRASRALRSRSFFRCSL
jgi:hypothetical protein